MFRKLAASLATALVAAASVALPAAPAQAEPVRAGTGDGPVVFTRSTGLGMQDVITCTGTSDNPHNSSGTPSAVTGKSRSSCTAPVAEIRAQAELWRYLEGYGFVQTAIGSLAAAPNSAGPMPSTAFDICQGRLAYWVTVGRHTFYAPPGYSPPKITLVTETPPVGVNC
ncbi:hypothetical protein SAMN05216553_101584 [Lentzea fradiae]|uniref:Secreted protein n=1 Tax=Lentzea fradiae TaxID=200378 RepID=A0A1G7KZM3_9PSEU|nr:hypothetical protein [Lentzea fradiae]SDF42665.1 hypothetical protein SAMN05216553_101584 [Lentzea fradiae]